MTLDVDAATLCYSLYGYPDAPKVAWDFLDDGSNSDGIYWAMCRLNGILWVVYRGSVTKQDWERDLYTFYDPFLHDQLGPIHPGFYQGLPATIDKVLNFAKPDELIGVTGHSLGAGRGSEATGELCIRGRVPECRIVFGEPHSGKAQLAQVIKPVPILTSYRADGGANAGWQDVDLVTTVPPWFDTPTPRTDLAVTPAANDPWGPFRFHHAALYAGAVGITETWKY